MWAAHVWVVIKVFVCLANSFKVSHKHKRAGWIVYMLFSLSLSLCNEWFPSPRITYTTRQWHQHLLQNCCSNCPNILLHHNNGENSEDALTQQNMIVIPGVLWIQMFTHRELIEPNSVTKAATWNFDGHVLRVLNSHYIYHPDAVDNNATTFIPVNYYYTNCFYNLVEM